MQDEVKEWKQLNNIPETSLYLEFPLDFTGKQKDGRATAFAGLNMSEPFILCYIHTMNLINGFKPAKITYDKLVEALGMSKETVCTDMNHLLDLGIIERVKQCRYKIKAKYDKKNFLKIDTYLLKRQWEKDGKRKRLARSRILAIALLKRSLTNPKTDGVFISSQARIGSALNLPKSTAGDTVRELKAFDVLDYEKINGNDERRRGCSLFTLNPQIKEVKNPNTLQELKALFNYEPTADELHKRFMLDTEYSELIERINANYEAQVKEIKRSCGEDTETLVKLEAEKVKLGDELEHYFKIHKVNRQIFPLGFFRTDNTENTAI